MSMTLILWASVIWIPVLMYFMYANETRFKKNLTVGVTFPQTGRTDGEVLQTLKAFKRVSLAVCLGLVALAGVCMAVPALRNSYVLWFVWIDLVMVLPAVPYAVYNGRLKAIKRRRGWNAPAVRAASISAAALEVKWLSPWWFALPVALALLPMVFDRSLWLICITDGVTAALCFFGYRYLYRNRAEAVDENDALTQALTRIRRRAWGQVWLLCAWMIAAIDLWIWLEQVLFGGKSWVNIAAMLVFAVVLMAVALSVEFRTRRAQERLTADSGTDFYVDEDERWIWGMLYYNPTDERLIVNNRVGVNTTVNVARPAGKVLMAVVVLLLIAMPLMGVWMENMEDTPVALELVDDTLTASHGRTRYEIDLTDIEAVELLDALPDMTRTNGTGMDSVLKGWFSTPWGRARVCLDPRTGPWLHIELADGSVYLVGSSEVASVPAVYDSLK